MLSMTLTKASVQTLHEVMKWVAERMKQSDSWSLSMSQGKLYSIGLDADNHGITDSTPPSIVEFEYYNLK